MNYSEMTDFEINCAVATSLVSEFFYNSPREPGKRRKSFVINDRCRDVYESGAWSSDVFDPCKSWTDAGPIIEKHKICLAADVFAEPEDGGDWVAQPAYGWDSERVRHDNPLRAAMIVFLMMQESEK